jgi:hypothetical protein
MKIAIALSLLIVTPVVAANRLNLDRHLADRRAKAIEHRAQVAEQIRQKREDMKKLNEISAQIKAHLAMFPTPPAPPEMDRLLGELTDELTKRLKEFNDKWGTPKISVD